MDSFFLPVTRNDHIFVCLLRISIVFVRMFREENKDQWQGFGRGLYLFSHLSGFKGCELAGSLGCLTLWKSIEF